MSIFDSQNFKGHCQRIVQTTPSLTVSIIKISPVTTLTELTFVLYLFVRVVYKVVHFVCRDVSVSLVPDVPLALQTSHDTFILFPVRTFVYEIRWGP